MKEKKAILIKEAYKSFRKKRYWDTILLLEKIISSDINDPYPYFLLSVSYLLNEQFNEADSIMKRMRSIDPDYPPFVQLESFISFKSSRDMESALSMYIDKLEQFPKDKYISKAIKNLRSVKDFNSFQKNAKLKDFVFIPKPGRIMDSSTELRTSKFSKIAGKDDVYKNKSIKRKSIAISLISIVVAALLIVFYFVYFNLKIEVHEKYQIDTVALDTLRYDLIDKIKKEKSPVFYYSNEEVLNDFNNAKRLIKNKGYNDAQILINKIQNSNANFRVKERISFFNKFLRNVDDREYSKISVQKVLKKPYIYRGIFIRWDGKIVNLKRRKNKLFFNLLVDYEKDDLFAGVIDVYSDIDYQEINNGDIVLLNAVFINTVGSDNRIYLIAKDIKKK